MPIFETDGDRANEARIAAELEVLWKCDIRLTSTLDDFDFAALRGGRLRAIGEIKSRQVPSDEYGGYVYFDVDKTDRLEKRASDLNTTGVVILEYLDGLFWIRASDVSSDDVVSTSRRDRGNADVAQDAYRFKPDMLTKMRGPL